MTRGPRVPPPKNAANFSATENVLCAVNPGVRNPDPDRAGPARIIFIAIMIAGKNLIRIDQTMIENF
jgi:hypothetical protein